MSMAFFQKQFMNIRIEIRQNADRRKKNDTIQMITDSCSAMGGRTAGVAVFVATDEKHFTK